eukprot:TRINITY_DN10048_c0_g1_i1.p1 TRINITY_DN10048_c0_g1~~TRINITY_DN10048_c0_g1_i1.p1  ORF type:complete len:342 (-),score=59.07 TRINITY_DN10048_c0_g1_i1:291-1316(-)
MQQYLVIIVMSSSGIDHVASQQPWLEKYRPKVLDDVVGNTEIVQRLKQMVKQNSMQNLLLAGSPGTGKTTSVLCMARMLLGNDFSKGVLELNASDERGIDVVRGRIKMFAQQKAGLGSGKHKIIILDEADSMTAAAQQALRRTIEEYSATTRFAFTCNTSSKIIEPLQSRCAIMRFSKIQDLDILQRVMEICTKEQVDYTKEGLEAILFTAEGDMRQVINNLQNAAQIAEGPLTLQVVYQVCDKPHPKIIAMMLDCCVKGEIDAAYDLAMGLYMEGYNSQDIVSTLFRLCMRHEIHELARLEWLKEIGLCSMRMGEGVSGRAQVIGLLATLTQIIEEKFKS